MKKNHLFIINYLIGTSRNYRKITVLIFFLFIIFSSEAQHATWIWYPGDYEIWLSNKMQNRRTEREMFYPPFWQLYSHYNLVHFYKKVNLATADQIEIFVDGEYSVNLDEKRISGRPERLTLTPGEHIISLLVYNQTDVPSIFICGKQVVSDGSWMVSFDQKDNLFKKKQTEESTAELPLAGSWNFDDPKILPSMFKLPTKPEPAESSEKTGTGVLVDFGKETFGFVQFHGLKGNGQVAVYYGESKEEALATGTCETMDHVTVNNLVDNNLIINDSKAFRYLYIVPDASVKFDSVSMLYEYLPLEERGRFRCSDEQINRIWDVAAYSLRLTSREFFIDGIKRDRWVWSGDAYQSYLMNYYLFFDSPLVKRTLVALRGKSPVSSHINTILDYSFYWFLGVYDYYLYTGDLEFVRTYYPRMVELMDFCLNRRDQNGMMVGLPGDWVYIDWADMGKNGELSFEQILFTRSLETMALCAGLLDDQTAVAKYGNLAAELKSKLIPAFWSDEKHAFVHTRVDGKQSDTVTRYANMFAIFFGYLDNQKQQEVKQHVLLNDQVQKITTPYMRFYELEAMCAMGENNYVRKEIKNYWGGMLDLGATSFWEKYNPDQKGVEHYAMYGRSFGKSLCHAWGASPIYLLGKYFLGVKPVSPGYKNFVVEPKLGGLEWIEGSVPTPDGNIDVWCNLKEIKVKSSSDGAGTLRFKSLSKPVCKTAEIKQTGEQQYEITILKNQEYIVKYKNVEL